MGPRPQSVNSLAPGRFEWKFRYLIFQIISVTDVWVIFCELAFRWMSLDLTDDESTLVQVMAWCRQATSHKAQVTLCQSDGHDLYDLKNRGHRHGRLMKSWQHRTDILEVCSVGKRSAVMGKPVRRSFTVKLCRVGHDCGYDLFMDRFQSCVESGTSWDCHTQREGIHGKHVGIRGQRTDSREDRINITITNCLIGVTFTFSYISGYAYRSVYIYLLTM